VAALERTRDDILNDLERQRVSIDADRLTRVALLKRAVLKRCVYGVDLNPMAVELAKVSLWLDAFTLGAPLSFLDHHLKPGNSLIGARVAEVQQALEGDLTLFSQNKFAGVMLATDLIRQVSYLSDNTPEQTRQSAQAYREARDHLAPYKRVLDVYTSRWFGNTPSKSKKSGTFDPTVEFLRRDDTQAWLEDPDSPANRLPDDDYMQAGKVARTALQAAKEKCFFHWELEFPEVFFAPSRPGGQDVRLKEDGGFDAVVGNPPYDVLAEKERAENLAQILTFFSEDVRYRVTEGGKLDLFRVFTAQAGNLISIHGLFSFILPMSLLADTQARNLRRSLVHNYQIVKIDAFPQKDDPNKRVFREAKLPTCVIVVCKESMKRPAHISVHPGGILEEIAGDFHLSQEDLEIIDAKNLTVPLLRSDTELNLMKKLNPGDSIRLMGEWVSSYQGEINETNMADILSTESSDGPLVFRGGNIQRYEFIHIPRQGTLKYINVDKYEKKYGGERAIHTKKRRFGYQRNAALDNWKRFIFAPLPCPSYCFDSISYYIVAKNELESFSQLALLNSKLLEWRFSLSISNNHVSTAEIAELPVPRINFTTPPNERQQLTQQAIGAYDLGDNTGVLQRVHAHIDADQTDVVHDLLAHLAQCMIDLNKQKQAEVKRFLAWVEQRLDIQPKKDGATGIDSLTGKTIIQNYLGDYRKGEDELPWREFHYRLYQNRNRFAASLSDAEGDIQTEYEKSLATLVPIKHDLARTDALIDKIVYRLYGLTDEEIELIERPQYEQALAEAKSQVVADDKIKDDEEKLEKIAEGILPAARRFFERVTPTSIEAQLDRDLPGWRLLAPDAPTFLLTGDYNLHALPEHMDFSTSIIPYSKAVEVVLSRRIFEPFRAISGCSDADCTNSFLKQFMRGERELTIGSFMIILSSSRETKLRQFISDQILDAAQRVFGTDGLITILNDDTMLHIRNKAAHDEVLSRDEARQARAWALRILELV
jgi:hypothetical protein